MRQRHDIDAPRDRGASRARLWWLLVGVLVVGRIVAVPITLDQRAAQGNHKVLTGDVHRFNTVANHRGTPYQTFEVEYPPLMVGAIKLLDRGSIPAATEPRSLCASVLAVSGVHIPWRPILKKRCWPSTRFRYRRT